MAKTSSSQSPSSFSVFKTAIWDWYSSAVKVHSISCFRLGKNNFRDKREREREHFMFAAMHNWSEFSPLQNHFPFPFLFQVHEVVVVFFSTQKDCLTILNPYNHSDWFFILVELTHPPVAEFSISPIFFSVIKSTLQASKHLTSCVLYVLFFL